MTPLVLMADMDNAVIVVTTEVVTISRMDCAAGTIHNIIMNIQHSTFIHFGLNKNLLK